MKRQAEVKSPAEHFRELISTARFCASLVGGDVTDPKFKHNWVTNVVLTCITAYFIFTTTTIIKINEWTYMLEAFAMLGSVLQGAAKLCTALMYRNDLTSTRSLLERLYEKYQNKGNEYRDVLHESCRRQRRVRKALAVLYACSASGTVIVPLVTGYVQKRRVLIMHFMMPGLDISNNIGYLLTTAIHTMYMFLGGFGLYAGDLFVIIYLSQSFLFVDILRLKGQALNVCAIEDPTRVITLLRDIIQWHQFYTDFNTKCNHMYYLLISTQIVTSGISILCTLFIALTGDWPGAYPYFIVACLGLYVYCMLGSKIQQCNEEFSQEIYNIKWYNLGSKEVQMLTIMLNESQHPTELTIAGILPLSVGTALRITRTIYSMLMMLVQFSK